MNTKLIILTKPEILTVPAFEDFRGYLAVPYDQSINFTVRQINREIAVFFLKVYSLKRK